MRAERRESPSWAARCCRLVLFEEGEAVLLAGLGDVLVGGGAEVVDGRGSADADGGGLMGGGEEAGGPVGGPVGRHAARVGQDDEVGQVLGL